MLSMFKKIISIFLILLFLIPTAFAQSGKAVHNLIEKSSFNNSWWSVTVLSEDGDELKKINGNKFITPASNQKLLTLAAVLDGLGSDFKFRTNIYGDGFLEDSVWKGDLIIRGAGDPSMSGDLYEGDREFAFRELTKQLLEKGIKRVEGNIYGDVSYFDDQVYPKGWDWDDLSFYYGVQTGALSFNNNAVDLTVSADGDVGDKPSISWYPANTDYVRFINNQVITSPQLEYDEYYRRELGTNRIVLASSLPKGYLEEESLAIDNPLFFFLDSFTVYLNANGVKVREVFGKNKTEAEWDSLEVLATHTSEPLEKLLQWANKESDNFYTEMLMKTLSAEKKQIPGNFEDGIEAVREFIFSMGVDTSFVTMKDGSGMASGNFTTTETLAQFLQKMQSHEEFETYFSTLSQAGIDGTLQHRFKNSGVYRNFYGKSGFVGGVRTLSGYLYTKKGNKIIVSLATNHFVEEVKKIDALHEQIINYLFQTY